MDEGFCGAVGLLLRQFISAKCGGYRCCGCGAGCGCYGRWWRCGHIGEYLQLRIWQRLFAMHYRGDDLNGLVIDGHNFQDGGRRAIGCIVCRAVIGLGLSGLRQNTYETGCARGRRTIGLEASRGLVEIWLEMVPAGHLALA